MTDFEETRRRRRSRKTANAAGFPKFRYRVMTQCPSCWQVYTFYSNTTSGDFYCPECKVITDVKKVERR